MAESPISSSVSQLSGLGLEVPSKADVDYVDDFRPSMYGNNGFRRGLKAADHAIGRPTPPEPSESK